MRFDYNPRGLDGILRSVGMRRALLDPAERIANTAKELGPRDTDDYINGLKAEAFVEKGEQLARVNAYDFKSWWIEAGTGSPGPTRAYAPLRRALDAEQR